MEAGGRWSLYIRDDVIGNVKEQDAQVEERRTT
jgi:hypothetical protein